MSGKSTHWYWLQRLGITISSTIVFWSNCSLAQITPDATLPSNSNVRQEGNTSIIEAGTQAGSNLFHSFQEFSVPTNGTAFFNNPTDVQNIISRVTGGSVSNIDGLIHANGTANLFLINPRGIIFGQNARLNIGGSFVGSTASSLKFADGFDFSAIAPQTTPLLTINTPIGLQFGQNSGDIRVQAISGSASSVQGLGLRVPFGKTLALVGGNVILEGSFLNAPGGRIELGSVTGVNQVNLNQTSQGWIFNYQNTNNFGNIKMFRSFVDIAIEEDNNIQGQSEKGAISLNASQVDIQRSIVTANTFTSAPGGDVNINSKQLTINQSTVSSRTFNSGVGGNVTVNASESVQIFNVNNSLFPSALTTEISELGQVATGNGGNLTVNTRRLIVNNGGKVATGTQSAGKAGDLIIRATDAVELSGFLSSIETQSTPNTTGNAGNLIIETGKLTVQGGAQISSGTLGAGAGGNLIVKASQIDIIGRSANENTPSGLFTRTNSTGKAGDLTINTAGLRVLGGAIISSETISSGNGGSLKIDAADIIQVAGRSNNGRPSRLTASTEGSGKAGNLIISTPQLLIFDGAQATVSSSQEGEAGNLDITANLVRLDNGKITAQTNSGNGGNLNFKVTDLLLLRDESEISTNAGRAQQPGNGGNIDINDRDGFIVALPLENSDITANAYTGRGGRVNITAFGIFGIQPRQNLTSLSDITASSELGVDGTVELNTLDVDPSRGLVELPVNLVDASEQIAQGCTPRRGQTNSFVVTGRGGMPLSPSEPLRQRAVITQWVTLDEEIGNERDAPAKTTLAENQQPIIEAQGWVVDKRGDVQLVAQVPNEVRIQESGVRSQNRFCSAGS
ncbi:MULTISPECIES: S-layer family protein [unclassified Nostoc]|uniref:S-layer family protein n=1 Tax=unclassified Nostoc TaxID=2593658 RepID=UPI002AD3C841|nr:S-layer family protein [Nostoc sp. DedQUE03]MDZ7973116.1 S-layer family protein [Nostoc sp. DedQUE03]MDZ8046915.1 S-layer family protein [Nostoc sp. DedQUE02]